MCGFAGEFLLTDGRADLDLARRMAERLRHRGPDESGAFLSPNGRCAIGFRRLSILDVEGSHQPMTSADNRLTVAFNGEIYNFRRLREELARQGAAFRTAGDTEVLLHLYQRYGEKMLERLGGMFAMAIYDAAAGKLFLARDRLGQKSLWYATLKDRIVFASEAKAVLEHPGVSKRLDGYSLTYYLAMGYVGGPHSIWSGINKLSPAHWMSAGETVSAPAPYWSPQASPQTAGRPEIIGRIRAELARSVEEHMVSDVPLGALLSGGIDSAVIVSLMARIAGKAGGVQTFTAGFEDAEFDERPLAREVANRCGTDHTELLVRPAPAAALDGIVAMYDEPFADSSALPTWMICKAAREHVKVALAGDGGDEVFGGYDRYRAINMSQHMSPARFAAIRLAALFLRPWVKDDERSRLRRFMRMADALPLPYATQYFTYRRLFSPQDLSRLLHPDFAAGLDLDKRAEEFCSLYEEGEMEDELSLAQRHDLLDYLPNDLLMKTDIASMAASLELRAPMLDHDLVALGLSLPAEMKVSMKRGKIALREAFKDDLPAEVLRGRKRGFAVPLGRWLREDLRDILKDTLLDPAFRERRLLRPETVEGLINDHLSGFADHRHRLWALLVLGRWFLKQP